MVVTITIINQGEQTMKMPETNQTHNTPRDFGWALDHLKAGNRVSRDGWNGVGIFLELQVPDADSKMTAPYIYIDTTNLNTTNRQAPKVIVPWLASQTDMLAEDWRMIDGLPL